MSAQIGKESMESKRRKAERHEPAKSHEYIQHLIAEEEVSEIAPNAVGGFERTQRRGNHSQPETRNRLLVRVLLRLTANVLNR